MCLRKLGAADPRMGEVRGFVIPNRRRERPDNFIQSTSTRRRALCAAHKGFA